MKHDVPIRLRGLTVEQLLAAVGDTSPVPAGGAVAALAGALGGALVTMAVSLGGHAVSQAEPAGLRDQAVALQNQLAALAEADVQAFGELIRARQLPLTDENLAAQRSEAVQKALRDATEVPLTIVAACADLLGVVAQAATLSRSAALSDLAVAAWVAYAGLRGAASTARVNLRDLQNPEYRSAAEARLNQLLKLGEAALADALTALNQRE
jgi:formiminotetrahydrofolate cyclodeaminase